MLRSRKKESQEACFPYLRLMRLSSPPVDSSASSDGQKRNGVEDNSDLESKARLVFKGSSLFSKATEAPVKIYLDVPKLEGTAQVKTEDVPPGVEGDPEGARRKQTNQESTEEGGKGVCDGIESGFDDSEKDCNLVIAADGVHGTLEVPLCEAANLAANSLIWKLDKPHGQQADDYSSRH
ncbi:hypothetical protein U1Q18_048007 [Sarracenia purpurea var. burkii]